MARARPSDDAAPFRLGVLFVHGIGEQPKGDTLSRFGEPIVRWLKRWLHPPDDARIGRRRAGHVRIVSTVTATPEEDYEPVHSVVALDVEGTDPTGLDHQEWLLAESWWAGDFRRPAFSELAGWLLTTGTWVILSHTGKTARRARWKWLGAVRGFAASLPIALLVQILVALLAVLAILPIPRLRSALSGVLLKLTGTVGDSYVLVQSPVQRLAAITHVRRNLEWLKARCERIVVIAHSQGAAIAYEAVRDAGAMVHRLITLGSGLQKLDELRFATGDDTTERRGFLWLAKYSVPVFALTALFYPRILRAAGENDIVPILVAVFPLILVLAAISLAFGQWPALRERVARLSLRREFPHLRWSDYYASRDPVPNGPIGDHDGAVEGVRSREVVNLGSVIGDHNAYWDNEDEFVSRVVMELDAEAGTRLFGKEQSRAIARARVARRERVRLWSMLKTAQTAAAAMAVVGFWGELPRIGARLLGWLGEVPLVGFLGPMLEGIGAGIRALVLLVAGPGREAALHPALGAAGYGIVGALAPLAAFAAWKRFSFHVWKWYGRLAVRKLFKPRAFPDHPADRAFVFGAVVLVGLSPLSVGVSALVVKSIEAVAIGLLGALETYGRWAVAGLLLLGACAAVVSAVRAAFRRLRALFGWARGRLRRRGGGA